MRALLIGALVLGVGASATVAAWTDNEYATTAITAGTFKIESRTAASLVFAAHDTSTTAVELPLNATDLYPGQSRAAWIQIKNAGSVPGTVELDAVDFKVSPETSPHIDLRDALTVRVAVSTTTDAEETPTCETTSAPPTSDVPIISLPVLTEQNLKPNGANFVNYCVIVTLDAEAPSTAQGGVVTPVWTFTGTTN